MAPTSCCKWPGNLSSGPDKSASALTLTISPTILQLLQQEGSIAQLALTGRERRLHQTLLGSEGLHGVSGAQMTLLLSDDIREWEVCHGVRGQDGVAGALMKL